MSGQETNAPSVIAPPPPSKRIASIDQLRGYAIFGMILVNYLGHFQCMPWILKHHKNGFSYADTIAPLFIFVVGMGFRLSLARRIEKLGLWQARWSALKRYIVLFLVGVAFYGPAMRIDWWDALTDIALAGVLALPFIDKKTPARVAAAIGYLAIYMVLYMGTAYGTSFMHRSMNGGPLGPFSWAFILLFGTIAYDLIKTGEPRNIVKWSLIWGIGWCVLGWITYKAIPVDWAGYGERYGAYWAFSKRWCIAPSMMLATGLCFLTFLLFYIICDVWGFRFPHLTILGMNPLVIYLVQYSLQEMNHAYVSTKWLGGLSTGAQVSVALVGYVIFYMACYAVARWLHNQKVVLRL